ncbi:MAG: hypothetical protein QOE84_1990 [Actinomycetota bacterium]|jgi:hypothetical protein|nr:hypothetical protein [Actinomycetota bacterium]
MTRSPRTGARRRALAVLTAAATVAGGAALLGPGTSSASSHREAPYISTDPAVDNTDTYAFVSPDDANTVSLVANWAPFSEPAGGPNFFPWATDAAYDINIDNNGDAKPDIVYRWTFKDVDKRGATMHGDKVGGTFLYADGPVTALDDPNLLFRQTYDLVALTNNDAATPTSTILVKDGKVAPSNVGAATIPDFVGLSKQAITDTTGGGKSYVGQADDPFFLDLRVFDLLYGGDLSEAGFDTLSGYNVNSVVLKLPKSALVAAGDATKNPVIGVWSTTSRFKTRVLKDTNAAPTTSATLSSDAADSSGNLVQVSRLGNPLVNEAVVPANLKDYFNRSTPDKDAQFLGKVQDPELPRLIEGIYAIPNPNKTAGFENRPDLVATFLTGISKANGDGTQSGTGALTKGSPAVDLNSLALNAVSPNPAPAEYLRLNVNVPPAAKPNRLGVVGGDVAGFPNGRRLGDDVIDIALQALEGVLVPGHPAAVGGLGDGVNANDLPFQSSFPYIALPKPGSDPRAGQDQVSFTQNFTSSGGVVTTGITKITPAIPGGFAQLYRVNGDGSLTGLGTSQLNAAGTASVSKSFRVTPGTKLTLNWRVFPKRTSAAGIQRGLPTTFTVR